MAEIKEEKEPEVEIIFEKFSENGLQKINRERYKTYKIKKAIAKMKPGYVKNFNDMSSAMQFYRIAQKIGRKVSRHKISKKRVAITLLN